MAPRPLVFLAAIAMGATLSGCLTGERPTLAEDSAIDAPLGDPAVDAVLEQFGALPDATFTADYLITNNFGPIVRTATVAQAPDGRRSITIGDVRFLIEPASAVTCVAREVEGGREIICNEGIDDATVSDLQVTHQFYGRSAATRLRTDAERRVSATDGYTAAFAGRDARCVSVPVTGGSKVYCALPEGLLASYQGPDVLIELTAFRGEVEEAAFDRMF